MLLALGETMQADRKDLGVPEGQAVQTIIPNNTAFQTEDLDTYGYDCDDISNAQVVLMANISNYGSDVISEVPHSKTYLNDMVNQGMQAMQDFKQPPAVDFTDNEIHSDSNIIPYSQYLQETQQENLNRLTEDFGKRFTPQQELSAEQAFWLRMSDPTSKPSDALPVENVKMDFCDLETKNVELENSVAKLLLENERLCNEINHVKQVFKEQFDSIKKTRVHTKEQSDSLIDNLNLKSAKNEDLKAQIQDKEQADILRGIVKQAKAKQPNCVVKPIHDVDVKHSLLNANSKTICATCCPDCSLVSGLRCFVSKTMTGNRSQLTNFVSKFMGTVRFRNDHVARIMGYGDYQLGNVTISRVYYVEGLGHNLFSIGQFYDADLEVAFWKNTCFIHNLEGVDLLSGSYDTQFYTISLDDMLKISLICLLSKASKTKSWLWHRRLSHLNFGTLNKLAKDGLARGISRLKFQKDHLCSTCALGKSKKSSHQPKAEDTNQEKLYLLHMDLCGPIRVSSINRKSLLHQNVPYNPSRYNKTSYELMQDKKLDLSFFHVFGALCYPTNDNDDLGKLDAKADICIFVGYAPAKKAFRIYNKRTRKIIETIHVTFDELTALASKQFSSGPGLHSMTPATSSSGLVPNPVS
ncbi:integrase, catalytic region, zinc finger, CCHC-type containing protein [Tanacetum coccineum]